MTPRTSSQRGQRAHREVCARQLRKEVSREQGASRAAALVQKVFPVLGRQATKLATLGILLHCVSTVRGGEFDASQGVFAVATTSSDLTRIVVADDHGDSPVAATLLPMGLPVVGRVDDTSDVDVFRVDLQGTATLEVLTSGPTDTAGELLDAAGALLDADDDSGPGERNFLVRADVGAGAHYVVVTGEPGDYAVMARLGDDPDHGDTPGTATPLPLHAEADVGRVSPSALLAVPGRIAPTSADIDVFRLDVAHDGTDVTIRSAGSTDVFARLLDASMNEMAADVGEGNFRMETTLDAGTHYVVVTGSEAGTYRVLAWTGSTDCPCVPVAARDHGGDAESSTLMPIGSPQPGTIGDPDDVDVFRIDLQGRAALEVFTIGPTDTRGELLDATGARILSDDDGGPGGRNFLIRASLDAGTYYVAVTGQPGDYGVMARPGNAWDHADNPAAATLLPVHRQGTVARVSPRVLLATPGRIAPTIGTDVDVFRLDVHASADVAVHSSGGTDVTARLLDASLEEIGFDDGEGNFRLDAQLAAGIYYAEVRGRETGTYRLLASSPAASCPCSDARTFSFDFSRGDHGFVADFADYPPADAEIYELTSDHRDLPPPLDSKPALFLSGVNRSDDLFMYCKGAVGGLGPGRRYDISVAVEIATDTPGGCVGVGGAPGESVWIKAGASDVEPISVLEGSHLRVNVDVGRQSNGGASAVVLGNMANSRRCEQPREWELKAFPRRTLPAPVTASRNGTAWILFGVDSGFESRTDVYFTRVSVAFTPTR